MSAPPDIAALIAEADAALEFYQPSNIDYMELVKELRDALEACARDAARYRLLRESDEYDVCLLDDGDDGTGIVPVELRGDRLDASLDAAIDRARGEA